MPVRYRFDATIIVIELVGEYSMEELRTTILNSFSDPQCPVNASLLINAGESESIYKRSSEDIKTMARFVGRLGERFHNRIALVAAADLPFGLMRMSSVGSEQKGIEAEVFRTLAQAREWLLS